MRLAHQRLRLAAHSRVLLVPVVAVFFLVGALFSGDTDPHEAWATGCSAVGAFAAWIVVVIGRAVPPQAEAMLAARAGGLPARRTAQLVVVLELAVLFTFLLVALPLLAGVLRPAPTALDVVAGGLGTFVSAAFGAALGLALGRPVRSGMAFAAVVAVYVGLAAVVPVSSAIAGPVGVSRELSVSTGTSLSAGLLLAMAVTAVYVVALVVLQRAASRWRG
ncbi:MAG: hypothetical protein Q7T55_11975 [Solirubrobacteraceae bacterium]|nr:hypothetical protein [Solirubrobacteraceae bacterium]